MKDIFSFFDNEGDYDDIDFASAANTLSEAYPKKLPKLGESGKI